MTTDFTEQELDTQGVVQLDDVNRLVIKHDRNGGETPTKLTLSRFAKDQLDTIACSGSTKRGLDLIAGAYSRTTIHPLQIEVDDTLPCVMRLS